MGRHQPSVAELQAVCQKASNTKDGDDSQFLLYCGSFQGYTALRFIHLT